FGCASPRTVGAVESDVLVHFGYAVFDVPAQLVLQFLDAWHELVVAVVVSGSVHDGVLLQAVLDARLLVTQKPIIISKVFGFDRRICAHRTPVFFLPKGRYSFSPFGLRPGRVLSMRVFS